MCLVGRSRPRSREENCRGRMSAAVAGGERSRSDDVVTLTTDSQNTLRVLWSHQSRVGVVVEEGYIIIEDGTKKMRLRMNTTSSMEVTMLAASLLPSKVSCCSRRF